jgi:hypothetical protein
MTQADAAVAGRRHRTAWLVVGVSLSTIVVAFLIVGCSSPVPPSPLRSEPPSPTSAVTLAPVSPTPTPLPPLPTETAAHLRWTKARTNLAPELASFRFKIAVRPEASPRYVGIDSQRDVWVSDDGAAWKDVTHLQGEFGPTGGRQTSQLIAFGDELVAFESDYRTSTSNFGPYEGILAGYTTTSTNGRDWTSHPVPAAFSGLVDGQRLVAHGGLAGSDDPVFATSTDAITWTVVPQETPWPVTNECWRIPSAPAGSTSDGFVAFAWPLGPGCLEESASIWRSRDLGTWTPVAAPTTDCWYVSDLVHGPSGFIATGSPGPDARAACVWLSRDGSSWTVDSFLPPGFNAGGVQLGVAPDGTFLAYGDKIWESTDGLEWYLSAPAANMYVDEIAGDLAVGCNSKHDLCYSLRISAP